MTKWILFFLLLPIYSISQNTIGLPNVSNFHKNNYNAGIQNWDIKQDNNGIIYFANNEGLLSFDGKYWNLYPLPNKTIVRSIEIGTDSNAQQFSNIDKKEVTLDVEPFHVTVFNEVHPRNAC